MANADFFAEALEIAKVQAGVRAMSAAEVVAYAQEIAAGLENISNPSAAEVVEEPQQPACDPKSSIRETAVTCLECGKTFKVLGIRHLRSHGLDAKSYKAKWGLKKDLPLVCKSLVRMRRKKMAETKIWEKTPFYAKKNAAEAAEMEAPQAAE